MITQLAHAALAKRLETEGKDISAASEQAVNGAPPCRHAAVPPCYRAAPKRSPYSEPVAEAVPEGTVGRRAVGRRAVGRRVVGRRVVGRRVVGRRVVGRRAVAERRVAAAIAAALEELRERQASMPWVVEGGVDEGIAQESLLRRSSISSSKRTSLHSLSVASRCASPPPASAGARSTHPRTHPHARTRMHRARQHAP